MSLLAGLSAADVPFDRIVREVNPRRNTSQHPIFQVFYTIRPPMTTLPDGWEINQTEVTVGTSKFDLYFEVGDVVETADAFRGIEARLFYRSDIWDAGTIKRMASHLLVLLQSITQNPATPLGLLDLLTKEEKAQILGVGGWNDTTQPVPEKTFVQLFEDQVGRTPKSLAAVFENRRWTYQELNARADTFASRLKAVGATSGSIVAVALERSLDMLAALIAVQKAGAAYLPLDIKMPLARIELCLRDAAPAAILTQRELIERVASAGSPVILIDEESEQTRPSPTASNGFKREHTRLGDESGGHGLPHFYFRDNR